ncbi:MAG TPA: von Willebrand factor type A domain-containing protein [Opitutaceae bacterium]|jgi:Ca-activated chloride channel family protein|nr:von Willebrand factor type A domain-containing protein [Opitutaceae bacterium]
MNETKFSPDDPRLTAYALGELEGGERAAVEAALQTDAAVRATVENIRATAQQLEAAFAAEPAPELKSMAPVQRPASLPDRESEKSGSGSFRWLVRFPRAYYLVAGLAAAAFAVMVALYQPPVHVVSQQKAAAGPAEAGQSSSYVEVPLALPEKANEPAPQSETAGDKVASVDFSYRAPAAQAMQEQSVAGAAHREVSVQAGDSSVQDKFKDGQSAAMATQAAYGNLSGKDPMNGFLYQNRSFDAPTVSGKPAGEPPYFDASPSSKWRADAQRQNFNTETYAYHADSDFLSVAQNPLSTFALDVDTASYANVRRFLQAGQRPPRDAVRIEELMNYFPYDYAAPAAGAPLAATIEVAAAPWAPTHRLVRIGLKAREVSAAARPPMNLVFLIDVSGSMDEPNKLPLVRQSLLLLLDQLKPDDRVAIVIYAGESGLALPSTPASHRREILEALDALHGDGSTNGARGLELAYDVAKANFIPGGANRVILATDGDFNVGVTGEGELTRLVEEKARSGVELTALGFGTGNYKDAMFEQLADRGHGNYGYIDTLDEAKKLFVEQIGGTLVTVARDVKVQVEFNPAQASAYRLIGYEDRALKKEGFNNDAVTAGDMGAGHTVTALYEIVPAGVEPPGVPSVDALKYQKTGDDDRKGEKAGSAASGELLTVKVRYTPPEGGPSRRLEFPLTDHGAAFAQASADFKFAAAVAGFGMILRDSPDKGGATLAAVEQWAGQGLESDAGGHRAEFLRLVRQAGKLAQ